MTKDQLISQHGILREGYIKLLNDKDVMLKWGKPQLEALYTIKIGNLQIDILKLKLHIRSLQRKIELAQASINAGQTPNFLEIEITVAEKLAEAEMQIMKQTAALQSAKQFLSHLETPERSSDLRKLFRKLAKSLHPDVNPTLSDAQIEVWHKIKDAYETGDMERLKALQVVYEEQIKKTETGLSSLTEDEILFRNNVLKEGIKVLEEELAQLNQVFPFNLRDKINNEEWVNEQQAAINKEMEELKILEKELEKKYQLIRSSYE